MRKKDEQQTAAQIIQLRRNRALSRQGWVQLFTRLLMLGLVGWVLLTQVFLIVRASGNSMFPAVKDGDLLFGFRLKEEYREDDVIVYTVDGETYVGRIVALSGDAVTLDDSGTLLVNGTAQGGEILYPTYAKGDTSYPYTVPDGCAFVLGDYRTQTEDSRDFGPIPMENVEGKVITILRRRGL